MPSVLGTNSSGPFSPTMYGTAPPTGPPSAFPLKPKNAKTLLIILPPVPPPSAVVPV